MTANKNVLIPMFILCIAMAATEFGCAVHKKVSSKPIFVSDSIFSKSLSEFRIHDIYLPIGYVKGRRYPIMYGTDGIDEQTIFVLDSLIKKKKILPFIYVSSRANVRIADSTSVKTGDGKAVRLAYRNFDYINNNASGGSGPLANRFEQHLEYFVHEFVPHVEKTLSLPDDPHNRYYTGFSNGAGFGVQMLNRYPELMSNYCCFSPFGADPDELKWVKGQVYPELFWWYGNEEPDFLNDDAAFIQERYNESRGTFHLNKYDGGHSHKLWRAIFIDWCLSEFAAI